MFGFSVRLENIDNPAADDLDDLIVAGNGVDGNIHSGVGAVYPYLGPDLDNSTVAVKEQLPAPEQNQLGMGERYPAVGRADTSFAENLVFMCSPHQNGLSGFANEGAVQVFRPRQTPNPWIQTLRPPVEAGAYPNVDVAFFGHAIAIGDVDNDGTDDLVVGAPLSRLCPGGPFNQGRIYIFFGSNGWLASASTYTNWVGVVSPLVQVNCQNPDREETFGWDVAVTDIDLDGCGDVVVGAPAKGRGQIGSAYIYSGSALAALSRGKSHDVSTAPPSQTLVPPAPYNNNGGAFGWSVYAIGNMGSDSLGPAWQSGRPDIAIHAEGTDFDAATPRAGALFIYFGDDDDPSAFVDEQPVTLFAPIISVTDPATGNPVVVHRPQVDARFGRAAAAFDWLVELPGGGTELRRHLIVGDPDASVQDPSDPRFPNGPEIQRAGRVFCFQAPLHEPANQTNAWGTFVLLEPRDTTPERSSAPFLPLQASELGPTADARFGAHADSGNYAQGTATGEFVVSARNKDLPWPTPASPTVTNAGQVYAFRIPD